MTITEPTTTLTDLLLGVVVVAGIAYLARTTMPSGVRRLWFAGLGLFALAAFLGVVVHGHAWSPAMHTAIWQPLYLSLGAALAFIVAGAVADWRGYPAGRRVLPALLVLALAFYGATWLSGGEYLVFVIFQGVAVLTALAIYGRLKFVERRPGAGLLFAGFGLSLVGGMVQAMKHASLTLIWHFDHNGLYHLVQLLGVLCMVAGLRRTLGARAVNPGT